MLALCCHNMPAHYAFYYAAKVAYYAKVANYASLLAYYYASPLC